MAKCFQRERLVGMGAGKRGTLDFITVRLLVNWTSVMGARVCNEFRERRGGRDCVWSF